MTNHQVDPFDYWVKKDNIQVKLFVISAKSILFSFAILQINKWLQMSSYFICQYISKHIKPACTMVTQKRKCIIPLNAIHGYIWPGLQYCARAFFGVHSDVFHFLSCPRPLLYLFVTIWCIYFIPALYNQPVVRVSSS